MKLTLDGNQAWKCKMQSIDGKNVIGGGIFVPEIRRQREKLPLSPSLLLLLLSLTNSLAGLPNLNCKTVKKNAFKPICNDNRKGQLEKLRKTSKLSLPDLEYKVEMATLSSPSLLPETFLPQSCSNCIWTSFCESSK